MFKIFKDREKSKYNPFHVVLIFLITFVVYLKTLCPVLYVGDSGEFIAAAQCLGIPHPPGYPLYTILQKIGMLLIPFGGIAFRANMTALILGAATSIFIYLLVLEALLVFMSAKSKKQIDIMQSAALFSSFTFGFSRSFWSQCVITEVYTLNMLILSSIFFLIFKYIRKRKLTFLYAASFLFGIGLTNHHTMILFFPVFFGMIIFKEFKLFINPKILIVAILLFSLGFSIYLYFPFRSAVKPEFDWGEPDNWENFKSHILRTQYKDIEKEKRSLEKTYDQFLKYIELYIEEFSLIPFLVFATGLIISYKSNRFIFFTILGIIIFSSITFIIYTNFKLIPRDIFLVKFFFIPSYLSLSLCTGIFLFFLHERLNDKLQFSYLPLIAGIIITFFPLFFNYHENDRSRNFITLDYGRNLFNNISKNGIVFVDRDMEVFTLYFEQIVEGLRQDVTIYDRSGLLRKDLYGKDFLGLNFKDRTKRQDTAELKLMQPTINEPVDSEKSKEIYYVPPRDMTGLTGFELFPSGIVYKVGIIGDKTQRFDNPIDTIERGIADESVFKDYTTRAICMVYYKQLGDYYCYISDYDAGFKMYDRASEIAGDIRIIHTYLGQTYSDMGQNQRALKEHNLLADLEPNSHIYRFNLGLAYANSGDNEKAKQEFKKTIELDPSFFMAYNQLGDMAKKESDFEKAAEYYKMVMRIKPEYPDIYNTLGVLFIEQEKYDTAIDYLRKVLSFLPKYPEAIYNLGRAYEGKGLINPALKEYEKACQLSQFTGPNPPEIIKKACNRLFELQNQVVSTDPEEKTVDKNQIEKAQIYATARQFDKAVRIYEDLIKDDPNNKEAYNNLGYTYDLMGKFDQAEKMYLKALELDPDYASVYNNLGASCANQKKYKLARKYWEKAIELDPTLEHAKSNLKQLNAYGLGK